MCQPNAKERLSAVESCTCGCCGCGCTPSFRRFFSTKEEMDNLKSYRDHLRKELAGLEECRPELRGD